jgi:hypothetical protein
MRDQEIIGLWEAYQQVHSQLQEVEQLDEEGLPYGPVGKGFKKIPAGKKREAMMKRMKNLTRQAMEDDGDGGKGSPRGKMGNVDDALRNPRLREGTDLFDTILEHLVAEGYADTNEAALAIMVNMSEEWRQSIVEVLDTPEKANEYGKKALGSMLGAATKAVLTKDKGHLKTIDKRLKGAKMAKRKAEKKAAEES